MKKCVNEQIKRNNLHAPERCSREFADSILLFKPNALMFRKLKILISSVAPNLVLVAKPKLNGLH